MYRLLLLLLLAGCVKEKIEHQDLNYAIDNGLGWQGMYEYLTPQEEGFSGMEGAPDGVISVFHGYKDTSELRGYTVDWIILMRALKADVVAVKAGTTGRIEALLRRVSQTYLTNVLNGLDTTDGVDFISARVAGRLRLRRAL